MSTNNFIFEKKNVVYEDDKGILASHSPSPKKISLNSIMICIFFITAFIVSSFHCCYNVSCLLMKHGRLLLLIVGGMEILWALPCEKHFKFFLHSKAKNKHLHFAQLWWWWWRGFFYMHAYVDVHYRVCSQNPLALNWCVWTTVCKCSECVEIYGHILKVFFIGK